MVDGLPPASSHDENFGVMMKCSMYGSLGPWILGGGLPEGSPAPQTILLEYEPLGWSQCRERAILGHAHDEVQV